MKYPSVTQVIPSNFAGISPEVLEAAADRGTEVHQACALHARNLFVTAFSSPDREGYFNSFVEWFDKYVVEVFYVEHEFIDEAFGFLGHVDLVCLLVDGRLVVVDLKTPAAESKTWRLQLGAYKYLVFTHLHKNGFKYQVVDCMSLRLMKTGKEAKAVVYEEGINDFAVFLSCLNVHRFFNS